MALVFEFRALYLLDRWSYHLKHPLIPTFMLERNKLYFISNKKRKRERMTSWRK
jgi:hypothetical protein